MAGPEDLLAQLLSLSRELLHLSRRAPHLGSVERDRYYYSYLNEYFALLAESNQILSMGVPGDPSDPISGTGPSSDVEQFPEESSDYFSP